MECKLIKGQHVLCIADPCDPAMFLRLKDYPKIGKVYTVASVSVDLIRPENVVITVEEIAPETFFLPVLQGYAAMAWYASAFKPLEKLKVEDFTVEGLEVDA